MGQQASKCKELLEFNSAVHTITVKADLEGPKITPKKLNQIEVEFDDENKSPDQSYLHTNMDESKQ